MSGDGFSPTRWDGHGLVHDVRGREVTPPAPRPDHSADRLTDEDRETITAAMRETIRGWRRIGSTVAVIVTDGESLCRIGSHRIGCSAHDLRPVENAWIRAAASAVLDGRPLTDPLFLLTWIAHLA